MTDFTALIANPKLMLIGAAAQFGIFGAYNQNGIVDRTSYDRYNTRINFEALSTTT